VSIQVKKWIAGIAATAGVAAGGVLVSPTAAQAASYGGQCGSGYGVIDSHDLGSATVYLTYNRSNGRNCVVTIRDNQGSPVYMDAKVSLAGRPWISDPGYWTWYAGPVSVYAPGRCIDWGGEIGSSGYYEYGVHCG
jgi:hypothetical protein